MPGPLALGAPLLALLVLLAVCAPAGAAAKKPLQPWATVNVCDTAKHPDAIGIRASMPGAQRAKVRLYVRFRVLWRDSTDGLWHNLLKGGDSEWIALGRVKAGTARETGQIFRYEAPKAGAPLLLRGRVYFQWRIGRTVVKRELAYTAKGHRSAAGSDPKGYSAATCTLTTPR
jgi:hypothetical protein